MAKITTHRDVTPLALVGSQLANEAVLRAILAAVTATMDNEDALALVREVRKMTARDIAATSPDIGSDAAEEIARSADTVFTSVFNPFEMLLRTGTQEISG